MNYSPVMFVTKSELYKLVHHISFHEDFLHGSQMESDAEALLFFVDRL